MKNRRGFFLAEETLKLVIAVICIGFLVYLLTAIYFNNQDEKDLELAKASLENLIEQINAGNLEVEVYNPEGWSLMSWPNNYETGLPFLKKTKNGIPLSCENVGWTTCLCICKDNKPDSCNDDGFCLENFKGFMIENSIEIESPPIILNIDDENKKITLK